VVPFFCRREDILGKVGRPGRAIDSYSGLCAVTYGIDAANQRHSANREQSGAPALRARKERDVTPIANVIVYRAADRLIQRLGSDALSRASRHIELMVDRRDKDRFLLWLRMRQAIVALQMPPTGPLH